MPLLSVAEVAERLGTNEPHVRALARSGKLAGIKVGKLWRFRPEDIEAVLNPPTSEERAR